jgi:hypothetical protein
MPVIQVRGLAARQGETAFAFFVLRLNKVMPRARLVQVLQYVSAVMPDPDAFITGLPATLEEELQIIALPWSPPDEEHAVDTQRRLIEGAGVVGVAAAWFFQAGARPYESVDGERPWSHGSQVRAKELRFPIDHYPAIIDDFDASEFGISFKLAGPTVPGESSVLLGFHAMWLAPFGGRYRNTAVTFDRTHHAAHLWVDRTAPPSGGAAGGARVAAGDRFAAQLVQRLLWIVSQIDDVLTVLHARFEGGGLPASDRDPFVLGGNPLRAVYARGGERAVDDWIAIQRDWSKEEVARMLRELAIELASAQAGEDEDEGDDEDDDEGEDRNDDDDDDEDDDHEDDDDESEGNVDEDRGRQIARHTGELLRQRALAGQLDPRAAEHLATVSGDLSRTEEQRRRIAGIVAASRDAAARAGQPVDDDPDMN